MMMPWCYFLGINSSVMTDFKIARWGHRSWDWKRRIQLAILSGRAEHKDCIGGWRGASGRQWEATRCWQTGSLCSNWTHWNSDLKKTEQGGNGLWLSKSAGEERETERRPRELVAPLGGNLDTVRRKSTVNYRARPCSPGETGYATSWVSKCLRQKTEFLLT